MEDVVAAVSPVLQALDALGVDYFVAGSVASTHHGIARTTLDADVVADLPLAKVRPLVAALAAAYYIDEDMVRDAVRRSSCFNVVHLDTAFKVDVYVLSDRPFDQSSFQRRTPGKLDPASPTVMIETAEDVVLHKLEWYRRGGEVADRQLGDVIGVLKVQAAALDWTYLERWARLLGVADLLRRVRDDAGT